MDINMDTTKDVIKDIVKVLVDNDPRVAEIESVYEHHAGDSLLLGEDFLYITNHYNDCVSRTAEIVASPLELFVTTSWLSGYLIKASD